LMARRTRYECLILLSALEANARLRGPAGTFELPVEKLWSATLPKGTLLTAVGLPARNRLRVDYERSLRPIMTQADREIADCARLDPERQYRLYAVR
jgi:CO/xanthine dehydrogenase FAD-binding subunit